MERDFYPFTEPEDAAAESLYVPHSARIAVCDDPAAAPRVVIVEPTDLRTYLSNLTEVVTRLSHEQGGDIPFMVIREIVENFIHAYFQSPTISILDKGKTLKFSDQGPGIADKTLALEYGSTSATEEMKHYIRGVGSGLPYVQNYMKNKGGYLLIEDNIKTGTVVTLSSADIERDTTTVPNNVRKITKTSTPHLTEKQNLVLAYLSDKESVGPTDLYKAFGQSTPTWSRVLKSLESAGYIKKSGQKYFSVL